MDYFPWSIKRLIVVINGYKPECQDYDHLGRDASNLVDGYQCFLSLKMEAAR
jgi:hypothetical protein